MKCMHSERETKRKEINRKEQYSKNFANGEVAYTHLTTQYNIA